MQEIIDAYRAALTGYIPLFLAFIFVLWLLERKLKARAWKITGGSVLMAVGIYFLISALGQGRLVGVLTSVLLLVVGARSLAIGARMAAEMKAETSAEMKKDKGRAGAEGSK